MPYKKIDFKFNLFDLHEQIKDLDYTDYIAVKNEFLTKARIAGYTENRLQMFWNRTCAKMNKAYGFEKPLSQEWKNVRMRMYRQNGTTLY